MDKNNKTKADYSGHRFRVKNAVIENGFGHLSNHRLLELLLFYSIPRADTDKLARGLIEEFGSWQAVFDADISRLCRVNGVGESTAVFIATVGELIKRSSAPKVDGRVSLKNIEDLKELAKRQLFGSSNEKVIIVCLDSAKRVKRVVPVSTGNKNEALVDVRKAVQAVMDCEATSAFIAHNHPENSCQPSAADIDTTRSLCVMFRKLGIKLIDHIVVGFDNEAYSMRSDPMFTQMFY